MVIGRPCPGSQVVGRAEYVFVVGDRQRRLLVVGKQGQAQIEQLDRTTLVDQKVGLVLHVAMDQSGVMGVLQLISCLGQIFGYWLIRQKARTRAFTIDAKSLPGMYSITR